MFAPDILSLRQFYASPFGEAVRALLDVSIRALWPESKGDTILSIGYATPYLEPYLADSQVMVCMQAHQGAACWPPAHHHSAHLNVVFLAHDCELPLAENSVNRILLLHSVEHSEQLGPMIEELWRVLTPGGRLLAVVPNRLGLWSRSSRSPFGYGRPFSMTQLRDLIAEKQFTLTRSTSALFIPPTYMRTLWRLAPAIEALGKALCPFIGGVLLVEAEKQLYASIRQPVMTRKRYTIPMPATNPALGLKP